jgi:uncharacterized LabA/DUF88 family protein
MRWTRGVDLCVSCQRRQADRLRSTEHSAAHRGEVPPAQEQEITLLSTTTQNSAIFPVQPFSGVEHFFAPFLAGVREILESRVSCILDSPNLTNSVRNTAGPAARPHWQAILQTAWRYGTVIAAVAAVNDGIPAFWVRQLRAFGYAIGFSHSWDCDDHVVSQIVRLATASDVVMIGSGDGRFTEVTKLLKASGRRVVLCSVQACTHPSLIAAADCFVEVPVRFHNPVLPAGSSEKMRSCGT